MMVTTKITDDLYDFTEYADMSGTGKLSPNVDSYLLIGGNCAAVFDTLQNEKGLLAEVRKYTDLPIKVFITHGHGDHVGVSTTEFANAGCEIFMSLIDYDDLLQMSPFVKKEWFTDLSEGEVFDLGGYVLKVLKCAGHTPGCVVFLEESHQYLFSGDTLGSGSFWMQLPNSLPLSKFRENAQKLYDKLKEYPDLLIYPGHRYQSPTQLNLSYVSDCLHCVSGILDGSIVGEDRSMDLNGLHLDYKSAAYGLMLDFCYNPARL